MKTLSKFLLFSTLTLVYSCKQEPQTKAENQKKEFSSSTKEINTSGMIWIPAGKYIIGTNDTNANPTEAKGYEVVVSGYWIDETEVTNAQFRKFVDATGYVTVAERPVDWEEIKKQLPEGTPKPDESLLQPGSMIFEPQEVANLYDISQWWKWELGADWKHPHGPDSNIDGKDDHPVVQIAFEDAQAYAEWAGKELPTEVQWEIASRGGKNLRAFAWGDQLTPDGKYLANFFQGTFPKHNSQADGYATTAPVKSYPPNDFGLYDMIGNVWEWTKDWYRIDTHNKNQKLANISVCNNPQGPQSSMDPLDPLVPKRVTKGGSFLCTDQYCSNYRPSARMATAFDSGQEHLGFRCVINKSN